MRNHIVAPLINKHTVIPMTSIQKCSMTMLQFNVMLPFVPLIRDYKQTERISLLTRYFGVLLQTYPDLDLISLNELIPEKYFSVIKKCLAELGFIHCTREPDTLIGTGGLCVFSKCEIRSTEFKSFGFDCAYSDCLALKGVLYTEVKCRCRKHSVHIFSTHLQAWDTQKALIARNGQLNYVRELIGNIGNNCLEPVVLLGDLNVDLNAVSKDDLQNTLGLQMASIDKHSTRYTFDNNNPLVGLDGSYETRDTGMYIRGCLEEYQNTGKCECCIPKWLDYVFFNTMRGGASCTMRALPCVVDDGDSERFVSDHYPLVSTIVFGPPVSKCVPRKHLVHKPDNWCVLL